MAKTELKTFLEEKTRVKDDYTDITFLVDRSGSMGTIRTDMEGAFNAMIEDNKKDTDDDCRVTTITFDSDGYEVQYTETPIANVPNFQLSPRNLTPLFAAQCVCILDTGERLSAKDESDRPGKVIVVTITDGLENFSSAVEWGIPFGGNPHAIRTTLRGLVKHQTKKYGWMFQYLGANQDAENESSAMGFSDNSSMTYAATSAGVKGAMHSSSRSLRKMRGMTSGAFREQTTSGTLEAYDDEDRVVQCSAGIGKYEADAAKKKAKDAE
jgi:hypothetical protein